MKRNSESKQKTKTKILREYTRKVKPDIFN